MKIYAAAFVLILVLSGCSEPPPFQRADDSLATPENVEVVVGRNNDFGFEIYRELSADNEGRNVFLSPYSISTAFAIAYEGARGDSATEMENVLKIPQDSSVRRPSFARLYNIFNAPRKSYELYTANALWAEKTYKFLDEYMSDSNKYYRASATNVDFIDTGEESRQTINKWVEVQTKNKIKDLIPADAIDNLTRLVITNAVYFKGKWLVQFDSANTRDYDFKVDETKSVNVKMMRLSGEEADFNYMENEELQLIELPYSGNEISMLILLPKEGMMERVEQSLTSEKITELKSGMRKRNLLVMLPRFKVETKYFLKDTLTGMGMPTPFDMEKADFSGMDGKHMLYISQAIHQAFVEVNEEGTEAAAASAIIMKARAALQTEFVADHPFIFLIQEKNTGTILFMGKVVDPTVAS